MNVPDTAPRPPEGLRGEDLAEWAKADQSNGQERAHVLWLTVATEPGQNLLATRLADLLGWPEPDASPERILATVDKSAAFPPGRVLHTERNRPAWAQRPELIAALEQRCQSAGPNAYTSAPVDPGRIDKGLFR
ncbi:hypothetical protein GCM10027176_45810 [Actinoallomurus bryophytorum]|uniref:Uncharacterized protein n=1 Tax=Actinoallomurus bryophytorum TaxID=1490222 RepID=A0A543CCM4_9ACTN|nr:hypothetical protein [Actinoallomurus bryophytorum]TQL94767.1 hypothetical protein FB559_0249 [Actinoallomurus bryophytorum]